MPELRLIDSAALPYLLSVPDGTPPESGWPVLCFLHGYDEAAPMPIHKALTLHGPLNPGNPERVQETFIIVAPQMPVAGDRWYRFAGAVKEVVLSSVDSHHGDRHRLYLTGFSFGGNGVLDLALTQKDIWAALWPVDLTRVPVGDPERPVWISLGEVARRNTKGFVQALDLKAASDGLEADRIYLDEGQDHVGSARLAYRDARIYDWLLARRL
ncbi:hypothetical protein IQ22_00706 [Pseudomonas duriflava]|uniref:Esterase n=1 Tax=Pseudomonas duriflava TaxID=459528 RepID=A0A562QL93_9PSED|nr:hypothetical protein [Pseudomonas duriflava]TWI57489.1 hypothetical protein IQ22_00706 [Pseudomonas duriflava]